MREVLDEVWRRIQSPDIAMGRSMNNPVPSQFVSVANVKTSRVIFWRCVDGKTADEIVSAIQDAYRKIYNEDLKDNDHAPST